MEKKNFETLAIRTQDTRSDFKEHSVPIYLSSSFVFDNAEALRAAFNEETDDFIYSRYSNPNLDELVQKFVCSKEQKMVLLFHPVWPQFSVAYFHC